MWLIVLACLCVSGSCKGYQVYMPNRSLPEVFPQKEVESHIEDNVVEAFRRPENIELKYDDNNDNYPKEETKDHSHEHVKDMIKFGPRFTQPTQMFSNDIKPVSRSIKYQCVAEGNPTPNITWYKNKETPIIRRYFQPSYGKWSMGLKELTTADNGNYTCVVCNELNCINHTVALKVTERIYYKPLLKDGAVNQTNFVGQTAKFSCKFESDMHLYVYWMYYRRETVFYNGTDGNYTKEAVVYYDSNKIVLSDNPEDKPEQFTKFNVTEEDEGWYVCVALNNLGNSTSKGYLTVLKKSSPNLTTETPGIADKIPARECPSYVDSTVAGGSCALVLVAVVFVAAASYAVFRVYVSKLSREAAAVTNPAATVELRTDAGGKDGYVYEKVPSNV